MAPAARVASKRGATHRPRVGFRVISALAALLGGVFVSLLMLSDRAPGILDRLFDRRARQLWARIDASERADVLTRAGPPEPDTAIHIALWFGVTLLVALAIWTWRGLVVTGILMTTFGVGIELAQGRWSSRSVEASDVGADLIGTALGLLAALIIMLAFHAATAAVVRLRRRRTHRGNGDDPMPTPPTETTALRRSP